MMPHIEQARYHLTSGALPVATVPDATMDLLLTGAAETHPGACRALYPYTDVTANVKQVQSQMTAAGSLSDWTTEKKAELKALVAAKMAVAPSRVALYFASGSVVI